MTRSDHGHGVSEPNARPTPKPVMPQPLAPLTKEAYLAPDEKGLAHLKRSVSSTPKGGFLSKTKSLLRKRTSTSAIRLNNDGSIGISTLGTLSEEGGKPPSSNKLSKRK